MYVSFGAKYKLLTDFPQLTKQWTNEFKEECSKKGIPCTTWVEPNNDVKQHYSLVNSTGYIATKTDSFEYQKNLDQLKKDNQKKEFSEKFFSNAKTFNTRASNPDFTREIAKFAFAKCYPK